MLSIQDESILPPEIKAAFEKVREGADVMPTHQLEEVMQVTLNHAISTLIHAI